MVTLASPGDWAQLGERGERQEGPTEKDSLLPRLPLSPALRRPGWGASARRALEAVREFRFSSVNVDRVSMALFPLSFALFNLVYWMYYLLHITDVSAMGLVMAHVSGN